MNNDDFMTLDFNILFSNWDFMSWVHNCVVVLWVGLPLKGVTCAKAQLIKRLQIFTCEEQIPSLGTPFQPHWMSLNASLSIPVPCICSECLNVACVTPLLGNFVCYC
jgi:hypothetical protein